MCLPKLLKSGRTHPATEPVPEGWIPCAHLYPPHPARDGLGEARPFDAAHHDAFQRMIERCGDPATLAIKRRVVDAMHAGEPPSAMAGDRHGRDQRPDRVAADEVAGARVAGAAAPGLRASILAAPKARPTTRPTFTTKADLTRKRALFLDRT